MYNNSQTSQIHPQIIVIIPLILSAKTSANMLGEQQQQWKPHAIMISLPYQGHINPFVSLALKLASRGILVTFVHLQHVHHKLSKATLNAPATASHLDFFSQARHSGLPIRYTTITDGFPLDFDRDLHVLEYFNSLLYDFPALVDQFIGNLLGSSSLEDPCLTHFLVTDTVYLWPAEIARKYNLVNVSFWTEPALVFSLCYHWDILREKGHVPRKDDEPDVEINYLPGIGPISTKDLMSYLKERESVVADGLSNIFHSVKTTPPDFILHNIVHEFESETLSILTKYHPTYTVGPIKFTKGLPTDTSTRQSLWSESDCTQWLDAKAPGSVLYISFGSLVQIPKQIIEEIAYGIHLSGVDFIWVAREGIVSLGDGSNVLPVGYEDVIKEKGLIIPWCDQINVLSNAAVGGFLTHCGWNSTMESMWCGVPMLCYPVTWDQPTNRKLVVDDWKIGINLCDGALVDRKEVAETIKRFMSGDQSDKLRSEASRVKETTHKAMEIDGSSERSFDQFVEDLKRKIQDVSAGNK